LKTRLPPQFVIDVNGQKYIENLTFNDIFNHIKSKHWHTENNVCTPHSESLYDHLISAGILAYNKAVELNYNDRDKIKSCLVGLLHDIGKPGTQVIGKYSISFKGHGIVGAAMLDNFWSEEIEKNLCLSKKDWGDICTCTCVHMCGYFPEQTSVHHMFNFQILPNGVKNLLVPLRYADQLSIVPHNEKHKITKEIVDMKEKEFINNYLSKPNIEEYIICAKKNKSIVIQLLGTTCSGKTTFANKLINIIGSDKVIYISRDQCIVKIICNKYNFEYEFNPEMYQKCIKLFHIKTDLALVNKMMYDCCLNAIKENKIIIIDSVVNMYSGVVNILPELIKNSYKINLWFCRNKLITTDLDSFVKLYGYCNIFNPFRSDLNWSTLISHTEKRNKTDNYLYYQADISLTIGWNYCNEHVINHIINNIYKN
jgi:putative nucleotidyltransferase with HDIG domain